MDPLIIKEDKEDNSTPEVILDKENNTFEISGNSLPEDVLGFYMPVIKWLEEYIKQPNPSTKFVLKLNYFNSSSFKVLLDIFTMLDKLLTKGFKIEVEWHYLEMDEDILATGQEFQSLLHMPIIFKSVPD
jgi:hypothetical protein